MTNTGKNYNKSQVERIKCPQDGTWVPTSLCLQNLTVDTTPDVFNPCLDCNVIQAAMAIQPPANPKPKENPPLATEQRKTNIWVTGSCKKCGNHTKITRKKQICGVCAQAKGKNQPKIIRTRPVSASTSPQNDTPLNTPSDNPRITAPADGAVAFDVQSWLQGHPHLLNFVLFKAKTTFRTHEAVVLSVLQKAADRAVKKAATEEID